jgi:hypothetical protein
MWKENAQRPKEGMEYDREAMFMYQTPALKAEPRARNSQGGRAAMERDKRIHSVRSVDSLILFGTWDIQRRLTFASESL